MSRKTWSVSSTQEGLRQRTSVERAARNLLELLFGEQHVLINIKITADNFYCLVTVPLNLHTLSLILSIILCDNSCYDLTFIDQEARAELSQVYISLRDYGTEKPKPSGPMKSDGSQITWSPWRDTRDLSLQKVSQL